MRGAFTTFGGPCLQMTLLTAGRLYDVPQAKDGRSLPSTDTSRSGRLYETFRKPINDGRSALSFLCLQIKLDEQIAFMTFRMPRCKNGLRCLGVYSPIRRPWHFLKKHAYIHAYLHCLSLVNYRNQGTVLKFNLVPFWKEVSCCSGKQISEKPKCGQL